MTSNETQFTHHRDEIDSEVDVILENSNTQNKQQWPPLETTNSDLLLGVVPWTGSTEDGGQPEDATPLLPPQIYEDKMDGNIIEMEPPSTDANSLLASEIISQSLTGAYRKKHAMAKDATDYSVTSRTVSFAEDTVIHERRERKLRFRIKKKKKGANASGADETRDDIGSGRWGSRKGKNKITISTMSSDEEKAIKRFNKKRGNKREKEKEKEFDDYSDRDLPSIHSEDTQIEPNGCNLNTVKEEVQGTVEDTFVSLGQVMNAFTLQEKEIRAVMGRIDKAKRQLSGV